MLTILGGCKKQHRHRHYGANCRAGARNVGRMKSAGVGCMVAFCAVRKGAGLRLLYASAIPLNFAKPVTVGFIELKRNKPSAIF